MVSGAPGGAGGKPHDPLTFLKASKAVSGGGEVRTDRKYEDVSSAPCILAR